MKKLLRGAGVGVVLLAVLAIAVSLNLSRIVREVVERESTRSLRLATTLDSARVSLFGGKLGLQGLRIGSPRGFPAARMLELDEANVEVAWRQLRQDPIHVRTLTLSRLKLVLEQSGGALNFRKAMELLPASDPGKPPLKLVIDRLEIEDAQVFLRPGLPGVADEITVAVPSLSMKDVGRGAGARNGAAIKDVTIQVINALALQAAQSDALPPQLKALLQLEAGKSGVAKTLQKLIAPAARSLQKHR